MPDNQNNIEIGNLLDRIALRYSQSFAGKIFSEESNEEDDLMLIFGLTQAIKAQNKQYWGRELGKCWELLITEICRQTCADFSGPIRDGNDSICDLVIGKDAIDTKYRIGSGDSGTLKKFKQYADRLKNLQYRPLLLILRNDNLANAITSSRNGGWEIIMGQEAYKYIFEKTGFDLQNWLKSRKNLYKPQK